MAARPVYNPPVVVNAATATAEPSGILPKIGFAAVSLYTFLLYSRAVEFIDSHGSMHLMIITGVPAVALAVLSGGFFRALGSRIGLYLALFTGWVVLCLPFSTWRGGSISAFMNGWSKSFIIFLLVAGLVVSLRQLRQLSFVIAVAVAAMLVIVNLHSLRDADDRLSVQWGTLGNANDLATAILIGLPFCAYIVLDKRRFLLTRLLFVGVAGASLLTVLKTGSRGALLALILLGIFLFIKVSPGYKLLIAAGLIAMAASLPFLLTPDLKARYLTILQTGDASQAIRAADDSTVASALASTEARRDLLKHAIQLSITHPIFGVGYAQFPVADANRATAAGQDAYWHEVHNIFAMVLVENGLPALILYGGAVLLSFRAAARTFNQARGDPSQAELARFSFCLLTALTIYFICNNLATDAYGFQLPLLGGMAAALDLISRRNHRIVLPDVQPLFAARKPRPARLALPVS